VAMNPSTPVALLKELLDHEFDSVRKGAAYRLQGISE